MKKLTDLEIAERIERIGGTGWVTPEDYRRFSRQAVLILEHLLLYKDTGLSRKYLETASGSKRVASRIDELRDRWEIETQKMRGGTATYRLIGRRWEQRKKKPHCSTCHCFYQAEQVPDGQIGMNL